MRILRHYFYICLMAEIKYGAMRLTVGEKTKREFVAAAKHNDVSPSSLAKIVFREWLDKQPDRVKIDPDTMK